MGGEDSGRPKKSIRAPEEFWNEFDEWYEEEGYPNRSAAVRDSLKTVMGGEFTQIDQVKYALTMYTSGLSHEDEILLDTAIDCLYDIDEELGEIAESYLDHHELEE